MLTKIERKVKIDAVCMNSQGNYKQTKVAFTHRISVRTLRKSKKKLREHDDVEEEKKKRSSRSKIDHQMLNVLLI